MVKRFGRMLYELDLLRGGSGKWRGRGRLVERVNDMTLFCWHGGIPFGEMRIGEG